MNDISCGIWVQLLGICLKKPNEISDSSANPVTSSAFIAAKSRLQVKCLTACDS